MPKEEVYRSLAAMSDSLKLTVEELEKLLAAKVMPKNLTCILCAQLRRIRSEIGHLISGRMNDLELGDSFRFETQQIALEKKLRRTDLKLATGTKKATTRKTRRKP